MAPSDPELPRPPARDDGAQWGAWMAAAQAGDRAAYQALLQSLAPYLRAIATRYLGRDDAEDAVQEILIVIHDIRHTFEPGRPFKPWVSTIATRRCIDLLRRRTRRAAHETDDAQALERVHAHDDSPEDAAMAAQQAQALHRAVDRLAPRMREAVRLVHLEELAVDEAARRTGQQGGTLKVAAHRALRSLRSVLAPREPRDD